MGGLGMLPNVLAGIVAAGSFAFYLAAFFVPEVHRKSDFLWSGVGLFYALVLWFCARQMSGAVVLGQTASVALLVWLGWQTLLLRRATTPAQQQTPLKGGSARVARQRLGAIAARPAIEYEFVEDDASSLAEPAQPGGLTAALVVPAALEAAPAAGPSAAQGPLSASVDAAVDAVDDADTANEQGRSLVDNRPVASPTASVIPTPAPAAVSPAVADLPPADLPADSAAAATPTGKQKGWLGGLSRAKSPRPMLELPPRPPSIPRNSPAYAQAAASEAAHNNEAATEATEPDAGQPQADRLDDEASNWPDDEDWD